MKRALHIFPPFDSASGVEAFRRVHDSLAQSIPAHVTILFPFEDTLPDLQLVQHIRRAVSDQPKFQMGFAAPLVTDDRRIWLPVGHHREVLCSLHTKLYRGPMMKHLRPEFPYQPHVTLGECRHTDVESIAKVTQCRNLESTYSIDRLILERVGADERSEIIEEIELG